MAIVFREKSTCSICGLVLAADQDVIGHPAFLLPGHPLWKFSDSAMHRNCYQQWKHHDYFESILRKYGELWTARPPLLPEGTEFTGLPKEERERITAAIDRWGAGFVAEMQKFIDELGWPTSCPGTDEPEVQAG